MRYRHRRRRDVEGLGIEIPESDSGGIGQPALLKLYRKLADCRRCAQNLAQCLPDRPPAEEQSECSYEDWVTPGVSSDA